MTAGELPPEQVIEWLRSEAGEEWSRRRIETARLSGSGQAGPSSAVLNYWQERDVAYAPGLFSLREQAGYGIGWDWEQLVGPGWPQDPAYGEDYWQREAREGVLTAVSER